MKVQEYLLKEVRSEIDKFLTISDNDIDSLYDFNEAVDGLILIVAEELGVDKLFKYELYQVEATIKTMVHPITSVVMSVMLEINEMDNEEVVLH